LPFEDEVKLDEAWDLSVDVPRWFAGAVDTIGARDSSLMSVHFDTTMAILEARGWGREDYLSAKILKRLAARFGADYVICGTVSAFKVIKRSISGDVDFSASHGFGEDGLGRGGTKVYGGLASQKATIKMTVDIYSGRTGELRRQVPLDSEKREGDLQLWLPFQFEHTALDYYRMRNKPFGSEYFLRCVPGAIMKSFAATLRERLLALEPVAGVDSVAKEYLEGTILDRAGAEVYLDLGIKDNLIPGELLQVLRPVRPVVSGGDTLGWVERPVGKVKVRYLKSDHFSVASVEEEEDSLEPGWTVRAVPPQEQGDQGEP
jgi:hypothetical protein